MEPVSIDFVMGGDLDKGIANVRRSVAGLDKDVDKAYTTIKNTTTGKEFNNITAKIKEQRDVIQLVEKDLADLEKKLSRTGPGRARQDLTEEVRAAKRALDEEKAALTGLEAQTKKTEQSHRSFQTRIRQIRDEMSMLQLQGKNHTEQYRALAREAGRLTDAYADASVRARILSHDYASLQGVIAGATGLAGAFSTAQGAVGLFAGENADLAKIQTRVQSIMAITIGLQQVLNTLNKDSAFRVTTLTQAKQAWATATTFLNKQLGISVTLSKLLVGAGIGAIIAAIGLAVVAYRNWREEQEKINRLQEEFKDASATAVKNAAKEQTQIETLLGVARDYTANLETRQKAVDRLNAAMPDLHAGLSKEGELVLGNADALQRYLENLVKVEEARTLIEKRAEESAKKATFVATGAAEPSVVQQAGAFIKSGGSYAAYLAELQRIEAENLAKLHDESSKVIAGIDDRLRELAGDSSLFDAIFGTDEEGKTKDLTKQYQQVADQLAAIRDNIRISQLAADEAEVEQAKLKYSRLEELAKGNAGLLAEVQRVQEEEMANIRAIQDKKREEEAKKKADAEAERIKKEYEELFKRTRTFQQRLADLQTRYAADREKLTKGGDTANIAVLDTQFAQDKDRIAKELADTEDSVQKLYGDLSELSKDAVRQILSDVNELIDQVLEPIAGKNSKVVEDLKKQIKEVQDQLDKGIGAGLVRDAANIVRMTGDAVIEISENFRISMQQISAAMNDVATIMDDSATTTEQVGSIIGLISFVITSVRDALIQAKHLTTGMEPQVAAQERITREIEAQNILLQRQKTLLDDMYGPEKISGTLTLMQEARKKEEEAMRQLRNLSVDVIKAQKEVFIDPVFGTEVENKGFKGVWTQIATGGQAKTKIQYEFESVDTSGFQDIEDYINLLAQIRKEGGTLYGKEVVQADIESLEALIQAYQDAVEMQKELEDALQQIFTATTVDRIAESIIEGFRQGKRATHEFADDFENLMRNAILNSLRYQMLEEPLKKFYENFTHFAASEEGLTEKSIETLKKQYDQIIFAAQQQFEALQDVTGVDFATNAQGIQGIGRQLTEDTGREIVGIFNGMRLNVAALKETADSQLSVMADSLLHLARIEANTEYCRRLEGIEDILGRLETEGIRVR